ncbi:sugar phosphate isomerase/epimerase family protein [Shimia sediminis]|uniref:sugar phosphate isomerase/epimerase family protein n=1 Tax=Shimia sediminis TaxID=2497945 RepID=UPI001F241A02|nr:sugar phosphate isomerase/epimerase family protein [Shimia sediminis]
MGPDIVRDFSNDHSALALNTATLGHNLEGHGAGWSPEQVIDACAERGYGGIVFWRREVGTRAQEIGDRVRAAGMQVVGLCRTPFLTGPLVPGGHDAIMDDFFASIDMAAGLGASVLTIVTGGPEPRLKPLIESQKILADRIALAAPYAAERGVNLALEPLNPVYGGNRTCVMTVADALRVCDMVGAPNLGVAVDVYHVWWDTTLPDALAKAGQRILGYHLCDWLADTSDMLLDRGMMGDGVADLKGIRSAVEAAGYRGLCEVEIFSSQNWWQREPTEVLDTVVDRFRSVC